MNEVKTLTLKSMFDLPPPGFTGVVVYDISEDISRVKLYYYRGSPVTLKEFVRYASKLGQSLYGEA